MSSPILTIDQGTTNTKVHLVDVNGRIQNRATISVTPCYPNPGWVEQDAMELWGSVVKAAQQCLSDADGIVPAGIAITNQRESVLVWERKTGKPAVPVIVWQCRRTTPFCRHLKDQGLEGEIQQPL